MLRQFELFDGMLEDLSPDKQLITTLNTHSFNMLQQDLVLRRALKQYVFSMTRTATRFVNIY